MGSGASQTVARHVGVDALGVPGGDLVGLVPDADGAVGIAGALVEGLPGGKVLGVAGVGVDEEVVEAAPVLNKVDSARRGRTRRRGSRARDWQRARGS